jgi:tetratricopeptide (TPR) repeat protein
LAAALTTATVAGCAASQVPPMGWQGRPFQPEPDERALWTQAAEERARLLRSVKAYDDPALAEYLARLAARLVSPEARAAGAPVVRLTVVLDPTLNAFAWPDGHMLVHTGLLARLHGEAQLATMLAIEIAHVTGRHALRAARAAASPAGDAPPRPLYHVSGLPLAFTAAVTGPGRGIEREAAAAALERIVAAGYDPREAARAFERLAAGGREMKDRLETFRLGQPDRLEHGRATMRRLVATRYQDLDAAPLVRDTEECRARLLPVLRENAGLDARAGRFALAHAQLDRVLEQAPRDPTAHLQLGDLWRLQAQRARPEEAPGLLARARAAYERAAALDPGYADPHRQLGLLHYQAHDTSRAREAFQRYLALAPDAADARRIREYVAELER